MVGDTRIAVEIRSGSPLPRNVRVDSVHRSPTTSSPGPRERATFEGLNGVPMKLTRIVLSNFQCFGEPTSIDLSSMTFLLGPNGAGKTAVLQALARMFSMDPSLRGVRVADFNVAGVAEPGDQDLFVEARFELPELADEDDDAPSVPALFEHFLLDDVDGPAEVRVRLSARLHDGKVDEEHVEFVISVDGSDEPIKTVGVTRHDRWLIQVHYLPARRDPANQISYAANSLLGRALRAADWQAEHQEVIALTKGASDALAGNPAVVGISGELAARWSRLHKGAFFKEPLVTFENNEIESLLRYLALGFKPGHGEDKVDASRLSDGQQSLLYVSLVMAMHSLGQRVLAGEADGFDLDRLRPPVFSLLALEEPENSLSPYYLGRLLEELTAFAGTDDAQVIVTTHSPSLLRRVDPDQIRHLRLGPNRQTLVRKITMPEPATEAHKYVREAVQAFPELYFARMVVLGEGDSEEIVLPRLLAARGVASDQTSTAVVPLGGRHVNHFWRLLHGLGIPFITLLDLDVGRNQGGWGRIRYASQQLMAFPPEALDITGQEIADLSAWDSDLSVLGIEGTAWIERLAAAGVIFSRPLDLDLAMIRRYPDAYSVLASEVGPPDAATVVTVLGKAHGSLDQFEDDDRSHFEAYRKRFKSSSKPASHLEALSLLTDDDLVENAPEPLTLLVDLVGMCLAGLPE